MARNSHSSAYLPILLAGLCGGALDLTFAFIWYGLRSGIDPGRLLQGIAYGALGKEAFQLGATSMALGLLSHFFASICAAGVYYLVSLRVPLLIRRPLLSGAIFGIGMYLTMNGVVIPLSHVGFRIPKLANIIGELCSHIFLFGFAIALIIARARRSGATIEADAVKQPV